jgi:hypothetical protein
MEKRNGPVVDYCLWAQTANRLGKSIRAGREKDFAARRRDSPGTLTDASVMTEANEELPYVLFPVSGSI